MRDIYQHAEQALVCLSTEEGTERVSGRLLHKLLKIIPSRLDDHSGMKLKAVRPLFQKIPSEEAQSFLKIFLSQWWRRAWVYQEFVVSSDAIFLCTGHSMHWHFLLNAAEAVDFKLIRREFQSLAGWCHEAGMREALVVALTLLHAKRRWTGQSDIKTLLAHARFMDASDTRDKIYAFLGLAEQDYSITPDYSVTNTASDLCLQITTNIILAENRLTVLELAAQCSLPGPGGPSWVLNMQPPLDGQYHSLLFHPSEHPKEAGPAVKFVPRNEETGPRLLVQGVRLSKTLVEAHYSETRCAVEPRRSFRTPLCEQDELWFLFGARPPYVLRPKGYHFIFIGEAWNTHCCDQDPLGAVYLDRYNAERQVLEAVKTSLLQWTEVSVI
jgi:hypothetical protein